MLKKVTDQLGRTIEIPFPPQKIVSLVPSQTEYLFDLGLDKEIVGITKFCIHPLEKCKTKTKVGGTKKVEFNVLRELQPDLIIANKEENTKEEIEQLQKEFPLWISDINDLSSALDMMIRVGEITGKATQAKQISEGISKDFDKPFNANYKVAYFIWRKPYMVSGNDTFIHAMLSHLGFENVFKNLRRYPVVDAHQIRDSKLDFILLSSEPYPFSLKHIEEFQQMCPEAKVVLVDGEYFSWYGSRLLGAVSYFRNLLERIG